MNEVHGGTKMQIFIFSSVGLVKFFSKLLFAIVLFS